MNTLAYRSDARRLMKGNGLLVLGLYRISCVDWLLAEQKHERGLAIGGAISSVTTLRFADLDGLPQDTTMEPLNTRSLTDVCRRAREWIPPLRKGKLTTENKPNNKHHKMYRRFSKPPRQTPGEYSREHTRAISVEGDSRRNKWLDIPMDDGLVAAYDPLDIKNAKYWIVTSSVYVYTPRSLFWPGVIFLVAPKLDCG